MKNDLVVPFEFQDDIQRAVQAEDSYLQGDRKALNQATEAWENILGHSQFPAAANQFRLAVFNSAGMIYLRRYWSAGNPADLERAVNLCRQAVADTPPGAPELLKYLNNLGVGLRDHYIRTGTLADLEESLRIFQQALAATPPDAPEFARRLNNLGLGMRDRYTLTGELADLEAAIKNCQQAVTATSVGPPELAMYLNNLGTALRARYIRTGKLADLEAAIENARQAVAVSPIGSPDRAMYLSNLGNGLRDRFNRTGALADLEVAIAISRQAVEATPIGSPELAMYLNNLGAGLRARYIFTGALEDLEAAITSYRQAVAAIPPGAPELAMYLNNLGVGLNDCYARTGVLEDLERSIRVSQQAVAATSSVSPELAMYLNNLGNGLSNRYEHTGALEDLDAAIKNYQQAVAAIPIGAPEFAGYLNNLGNGFYDRYYRSGALEDLEEAVTSYRQAVVATPHGAPELAGYLNNLGNGLRARYIRTGALENLEESIRITQEAVAATPIGAPKLVGNLTSLGNGLLARYVRTGAIEDLEAAVTSYRQALAASAISTPEWAMCLNNLGNGLRERYTLTGALEDLEESIRVSQQAVAATPPDATELAGYFNNLGNGLRARYTHTGALEDLEESIRASRKAVAAISAVAPKLAIYLNNLGAGLLTRYNRNMELKDLEESIRISRQAVAATPAGSPELAGYLNNLGTGLRDRYIRTEALADLEAAVTSYRQAALVGQSAAWEAGLLAARTWGDWASSRQVWPEAAEAYKAELQIAEGLDRIQLGRVNREQMLQASQGLASRSAYALARAGQLESAVEVIENGRARLLREAMERKRIDLERLTQNGYSDLYERYQEASRRWESFNSIVGQETTPDIPHTGRSQSELIAQLIGVQNEINALVEEIRAVPGYADFLRSLSTKQIQAVSTDRPLVYLLAAPSGGLALLVQPEAITPIWLDKLSENDLSKQMYGQQDAPRLGGYLGAYDNWRVNPADTNAQKNWWMALESATLWLWEACMADIVRELAARSIHHVVLIPCGLLGLLPLQAAWREDVTAPTGCYYALDTLQLTYAPSAHALLNVLEFTDRSADSLLVVENPDSSIPFAREAAAAVISHFDPPKVTRLEKTNATPERVKAAMRRTSVLQFYTHGVAGFTEPLDQSRLLLASGAHLSLREILELRLDHTRLAFLAACETSIPGTKVLDEVVALPSGFLQAGVLGVIGSQWVVADVSTMLLVARFYDLWKGPEATYTPAEALRQAQIWLRDSTNQEIQSYLKSCLPAESSLMMPEDAARVALDHLLLEDPNARLFAHPYYWAAFGLIGL